MANIIPMLITAMVVLPILLVFFISVLVVMSRRRGGLSRTFLITCAVSIVYLCGLLSYVLSPPARAQIHCAGVEWNPLAGILALDGASPLDDPDFDQMVANIILFMPFGFLARLLTGRGVIVAGVAGLATSLIIETSQLTGDWGVFPCAYRAFDTGDLLTNTVGAVAGSLAALLMARRRAPGDPIRVSRLTRRRRVAAMATDVVAAIAIFELTIRVYDALAMTTALFDDGAPTDPSAKAIWGLVDGSSVLFILIACAVHSTAVLVTGTTIGERVLHVRVDSERFRSALLARTIRILAGLGGLMLTALLPDALGRIAAVALILANAVGVFVTKDARGFAQFAAGMHPRVEHPDDPDGL